MTLFRSRIGTACTDRNPAANATGPKLGHRPSGTERSSCTAIRPVRKQSGHGPSWDCSSNSSTIRIASLEDATTRSSPSGATIITPAVVTWRISTHRSASSVSSSTMSNSSTRVSASSTRVVTSRLSVAIELSFSLCGWKPIFSRFNDTSDGYRLIVGCHSRAGGKRSRRATTSWATSTRRHSLANA